MGELRGILNRADENSLVLGDEICHGTEQVSGISLVAACLSWLEKRKTKFVFATHLHNLSSMTEVRELKGVRNYHLKVIYDENNDRLVYKRNLIPGSGNSVYGIEVARAMGLDKEFIEYANIIRKRYSKNSEKILGNKSSRYNSEVYVKNCEVCGENGVDTHHIKFQSSADADGFVDHRHKNHYSNLVILCKECHNKVHHGGLEIRGYIETSDGVKLDWE
jgi:DNA mismatch repair protein MutS